MISHLSLPYNWVDCSDVGVCKEILHHPDSAENLNSYPKVWVESLISNCDLSEEAIVLFNDNKAIHNDNGPACQTTTSKYWRINGVLHREDGPAIQYSGGSELWYLNGKLHREDGPALTTPGGEDQWWANGVRHDPHMPDSPYTLHDHISDFSEELELLHNLKLQQEKKSAQKIRKMMKGLRSYFK